MSEQQWTPEQTAQINAEMADCIISEVREVLEAAGLPMENVPPLFYPEAIRSAIGKHRAEVREACARIARRNRYCKWGKKKCDRYEWPECNGWEGAARDIEAAIRARGQR